MVLFTSVLWLITAQAPREPAPCRPEETCFNAKASAHFSGRLRGDAAAGYRVEVEGAVRLLDAPFTSSTQPRVLLQNASSVEGLAGRWVNAYGTLDADPKGLVLREAVVNRQGLFEYANSDEPHLEQLCTEPRRKQFTTWATAREVPHAEAFVETLCAVLAASAPATAADASERAQRLLFPFSYLDCRKTHAPRKFKTSKQFAAQCGKNCYPGVPLKDYFALEFIQNDKGQWQASMRGGGDREENIVFVPEEKSGVWKLSGVSTFLNECD